MGWQTDQYVHVSCDIVALHLWKWAAERLGSITWNHGTSWTDKVSFHIVYPLMFRDQSSGFYFIMTGWAVYSRGKRFGVKIHQLRRFYAQAQFQYDSQQAALLALQGWASGVTLDLSHVPWWRGHHSFPCARHKTVFVKTDAFKDFITLNARVSEGVTQWKLITSSREVFKILVFISQHLRTRDLEFLRFYFNTLLFVFCFF